MLRSGLRPNLTGPSKQRAVQVKDNIFAIKTPVYLGSHIQTFDNDGFSLGTSSTLSSFTFCIWIKTSLTREQCFLSRSGWYGGSQQAFPFRSFIGVSGNIYGGLDTGNDYSYDWSIPTTGSGLNDNNWHHIGFIYSANTYFKIYIDGELKGDYTHSTTIHNLRSDILWCVGRFSFYDGGPTPINFTGSMAYPIWGNGIASSSIITGAYLIKP